MSPITRFFLLATTSFFFVVSLSVLFRDDGDDPAESSFPIKNKNRPSLRFPKGGGTPRHAHAPRGVLRTTWTRYGTKRSQTKTKAPVGERADQPVKDDAQRILSVGPLRNPAGKRCHCFHQVFLLSLPPPLSSTLLGVVITRVRAASRAAADPGKRASRHNREPLQKRASSFSFLLLLFHLAPLSLYLQLPRLPAECKLSVPFLFPLTGK